QVLRHRPPYGLANLIDVLAHEGVEHQGHVPGPGMASRRPRLPIDDQLLRDLLDGLPEEVREQAEPVFSCETERLWTSGCRDPHRQLRLDRPGEGAYRDGLPVRSRLAHGLAAPEPSHDLDVASHDLSPVLEVLRLEDEVVLVPARREGDADATAGEVVDQGPVLGYANGIVQGQNAAAGADLNSLGDRCHPSAGHRGIRIEAAKLVEVTPGGTACNEAILGSEPRPLAQESVLVPAVRRALIAREVQETELDVRVDGGGLARAQVITV